MKRLIPLLILMLTTLTDAFSQTYDQLWKDEQQAEQKDLPKTQIAVLEKIAAKATKEKAYGQLLASTLKQASLQTIIAPDSLQPAIDWLTTRATAAEGHDEALAAVYNTVLGHIFTNNSALGDNHEAQGKAYYQKALARPDILGRTKAAGFEPLVGEGKDATLFGDDLLNVVAREVNDWATLADYYKKSGNREAACYASLKAKSEEGRVKSEEFNSSSSSKQTNWLSPSAPTCGSSLFPLPSSFNKNSSFFTLHSSLFEEYSDLPICGEVAIALYDELDDADVTPKEKYDYCTEAIRRWGTWPRMNRLRNEQLRLTAALLHQRTEHKIVAPDTPQTVKLTVRNIASATLTITRLDITGDTNLNPSNSKDLATLRTKAVSGSRQTVSRTYSGHAAYDIIEDSLTIPALTTGVYLLEFSTNENSVKPLRSLYRVTSVFPLYQPQPNETVRIAVVDLQTGQPKPYAKVKILPYTRYGKTVEGRTLTTDAKGEVTFAADKNFDPRSFWAYTETDKASLTTGMWGDYYCYSDTAKRKFGHLYTDRQIYRPGQTAHVAVVVYERQGIETKAIAGRNIKLTLRDANYKDVSEQTVKTDDFGTASADFTLPTDGLTGRFTIAADNYGQTSIQVEEYKRPTFEVELPEVTEAYKAGDTLTVIGTARTYAGVPVQNAKVSYTVNRREALWWWRTGESDEELLRDETTTDADGRFTIRMPLLLPDEDEDDDDDDEETSHSTLHTSHSTLNTSHSTLHTSHSTLHTSHFYNFVVETNVTDLGGESHEGSLSIPLGTKPTAFSLEMKGKFLADSVKTLRFNYRNAAGKPIDGTVRLTIDNGPELTVKANETLDLEAQLKFQISKFKSQISKHQLVAVCGTDTLTHDFIVFSLSDRQPVVETHDWFYISADEFPQDGSPVYVQVGSSDPDQHILYSIFSGKKLLESGAIDQSCALTNRKFTYKKEYGDGILLTFAWVKDGQLYTHSEDIRRPMPDKHLKLTWKTFRDRLTPGQDEEWTLSIQRPAGSLPTGEGWGGASLMATLYDKSLDQLSRHTWSFEPNLAVGLPGTSWRGLNLNNYSWYDSSTASYKSLRVGQLAFRSLNTDYYQNLLYPFRYQYARAGGPLRMMKRANINMAVTEAAMDRTEAPMAMESVEEDLAGSALGIDSNALQETVVVGYGAQKSEQVSVSVGQNDESSPAEPQLRENLAETAFFYPQLVSDAQGQVAIKFRLPESVTTWRFLGFAHDKDMNYGFIDAEAVAKKAVMVSPNVPRFIRQGDHATLTARIFNTSEHAVSGKARLELVKATADFGTSDAERTSNDARTSKGEGTSDNTDYSEELPFSLTQDSTTSLTFHLPATLAPDLYIVRITAQGDGFSDGEQHYLPILTNKEYVTTTLPLTFLNAADTTINASQLFPTRTSQRRLTVEYTQNPEWLAIQALPYMSVPDGDNAISLATAYFANTLGRAILTSHPFIRQAIELWQREQGDDKTLLSALEKNQELKTLVLKETPWVAEADAEREQRQSLIRFFDDNTLQNNLRTIEQKLQKLQNPEGSFSWWQGMEGSPYMTMSVVKMLVRLEALLKEKSEKRKEANAGQAESKAFSGKANYTPLLGEGLGGEAVESAFSYLSKVVAERVREMKEWEKKGHKNPFPSDLLCDYAYASALAGRKATSDILYIVSKMEAAKSVLSIYGKANTAVILHLYGRNARANDHLKSLKEYTVYREEMGRYFDTPKANYSWCDYRMPSQVAAIEALRYLTPNDQQTITEMQRWLLQEKRTTMWSTPINCVEAVWGSLANNNLSPNPSPIGRGVITILNAEGVLAEKEVSPIATTKLSTPITSTENLEVKLIAPIPTGEGQGERPSGTGLSFGAIYAQYLQDMKEFEASKSGLTVKREVMLDGKTLKEGTRLKVGDRIKVRITIRADRDYDFVQVVDKRAACLEPVEQTSGYRNGCYIASKDQETRYYFDQMAKGTHMFETEYYVDREGEYLSGTCTAQCAYSPEFMGRTAGAKLSVDSK